MARRLAKERCVSTDAIVRERLAGGEDAFLETLFGPFLVVPMDWRKRFDQGWDPVDLEELSAMRRARDEREWARKEAERQLAREAREAEERLEYPYKFRELYNCPRCNHMQHEPNADPTPKPGDFIQCAQCSLVLQFQVYGMHPYAWMKTPPGISPIANASRSARGPKR